MQKFIINNNSYINFVNSDFILNSTELKPEIPTEIEEITGSIILAGIILSLFSLAWYLRRRNEYKSRTIHLKLVGVKINWKIYMAVIDLNEPTAFRLNLLYAGKEGVSKKSIYYKGQVSNALIDENIHNTILWEHKKQVEFVLSQVGMLNLDLRNSNIGSTGITGYAFPSPLRPVGHLNVHTDNLVICTTKNSNLYIIEPNIYNIDHIVLECDYNSQVKPWIVGEFFLK